MRIEKWVEVYVAANREGSTQNQAVAYVPDYEIARFAMEQLGADSFRDVEVLIPDDNTSPRLIKGAIVLSTREDIEECLKRRALSKLTPAERTLLGVS